MCRIIVNKLPESNSVVSLIWEEGGLKVTEEFLTLLKTKKILKYR